MEQDSKQPAQRQRRVKVVDATEHRSGTKRAAVKPHKRASEPDVKQLIGDYLGSVKASGLSQTMWGSTLDKYASVLRTNFGLSAATDELYLLVDVTPLHTGKAGMLLSTSGLHLADGRGGKVALSWKELAGTTVGCQRGMVTIGQSGIATQDAQAIAGLLKHLQSKLA